MPTTVFQVTGERTPAPEALDASRWRLIVAGLVACPLALTLAEVRALADRERVVDIHCVTGWSYRGMRFTGFPLALLLDRAQPRPEARYVWFGAYSTRNHDTSLPLDVARADTWIVTHADGKPLAAEHGYPARTLTPTRYLYKSLKWLHRIELLTDDRLGFWERTSRYHNNADPWPGNERYVSGSMTAKQIERFRNAGTYDRYRARVLIGVDLSGWRPHTRNLQGLQLKNCNLQHAHLRSADLRGANLTNSDFRDADLAGADLRGADLEGAGFVGADLSHADLRETLLTVTRFCETADDGTMHGAVVTGMRWDGATGLFPEQAAYLRAYQASGTAGEKARQ